MKIEFKVIASTIATLVVSTVVSALNAVQTDAHVLGGLPVVLQVVVLALIPPLVTFLAGYNARHTPRSHLSD